MLSEASADRAATLTPAVAERSSASRRVRTMRLADSDMNVLPLGLSGTWVSPPRFRVPPPDSMPKLAIAYRISRIRIYVRICLQTFNLENERFLSLVCVRQHYHETCSILFVVQWTAPQQRHRVHRTGSCTKGQRVDGHLSSGSFPHDDCVQILSLYGEVNVIVALFFELGPRVGIVNRVPVDLQPFTDSEKGILLILRNGSIGLRRNIQQQGSVFAHRVHQPPNHCFRRIGLHSFDVSPT